MRTMFRLDGTDLELQAAAGDNTPPRLSLLAYTGGAVFLNGYYWPVVFDLSSTKVNPNVPLLYSHDDNQVVGHVDNVEVIATKIKATGILSGANDRTEEIKSTLNNGMPWQLSVGLDSLQLDFIDSTGTVKVNNKTFAGPVYVARQNTLSEISIVARGADSNTVASLVASYKGGYSMFEEWVTKKGFKLADLTESMRATLQAAYNTEMNPPVPPVVPPTVPPVDDETAITRRVAASRVAYTAETERCDGIHNLACTYNRPTMVVDGKKVSVEAHAIKNGWTVDQTELQMLKAHRPETPQASMFVDGEDNSQVLLAALLQAGHYERHGDITKIVSPKVLDAAHKRFHSRIGCQELFMEAARIGGYTGSYNFKANMRKILKAAFTSIDLDTVLTTNFNTFLIAGYNAIDNTWRQIVKIGRVSDFKEMTSFRVTGGLVFEEIAPDGHIPHGELGEQTYGNRAKPHGIMAVLTYVDIVNDNFNAFADLPRMMGRGGKLGLVKGVWTEFMDNAAFFVAGNNNVSSGALSVAGLNSATNVFRKLKDPDGEYLYGTPRFLVAPPELEATANQLWTSTNLAGTASPTTPSDNPFAGKYRPIISPFLSDTAFTGNSTTAYYLIADPNDVPVQEVVFLDGVEEPTVETAEADFSQLGVQYRGTYHWGTRKQDPNGGVRSTGV